MFQVALVGRTEVANFDHGPVTQGAACLYKPWFYGAMPP